MQGPQGGAGAASGKAQGGSGGPTQEDRRGEKEAQGGVRHRCQDHSDAGRSVARLLLVFTACVLSYSRPLFTCVYSCRIASLRFGPFLRPILVHLACVLTPVLVHLMGSTLRQPLIPLFPRSPDSSVDLGKLCFAQLSHCLADQKAAGC